MKKFLLFVLLGFSVGRTSAQVVSLNENFNSFCAVSGSALPTHWSLYGIYPDALLGWNCAPADGRSSTPGISCNNFDGTAYFVDTAWLFTPQLNLSYYTGSIYLQYDTRFASNAARLAVMVSNTYIPGSGDPNPHGQTWYDITAAPSPVIGGGSGDSWETIQVDLTPFASSPMYVAFRYTSDVTGSGKWIIDNVKTTQQKLGVPDAGQITLPLTIIGNSAGGNIHLAYSITTSGKYAISVYDITGRKVYEETLTAAAGTGTYTIPGISLHSGMYLVKMSNDNTYGTARVVIP